MYTLRYSFVLCLFSILPALLIASCGQRQNKIEQDDLTQKSSTKAKLQQLKKDGFRTFDYVDEESGDTIIMQQYFIAFLKKGPNRNQDSLTSAKLQNAHMENIGRLAEEGKLIVAGPFLDDTDLRGIYVFDVKTVEEAEALTQTDPAIQAGSLIMELHPWYGSAAMMAIPEIYPKLSKVKI